MNEWGCEEDYAMDDFETKYETFRKGVVDWERVPGAYDGGGGGGSVNVNVNGSAHVDALCNAKRDATHLSATSVPSTDDGGNDNEKDGLVGTNRSDGNDDDDEKVRRDNKRAKTTRDDSNKSSRRSKQASSDAD